MTNSGGTAEQPRQQQELSVGAPPNPAKMATLAIVGVGAALSLALNLPGHLSYDSVVQLAEGRAGIYSGEHPPVMSWLLGVVDRWAPGASLFVVIDTALIFGALTSLIALGNRTSWLAAILACGLAAAPQLLIFPAIVWKDVLFAAAATAGFTCLSLAAACWRWRRGRYPLLTGALLLLTTAALARQNGPVILPFAAAAVGWLAARAATTRRLIRGWSLGLAFLAAAGLTGLVATLALESRTEATPVLAGQWEVLQTYDIVSALSLEPRWTPKVLRSRAPRLEGLLRSQGVAAYTPVRADSMEAVLDEMTGQRQSVQLIAGQWRELVLGRPLLYLRVRARAFAWVFLTPDPKRCGLVLTGVEGPSEEMRTAGLVPRRTAIDQALTGYALGFASTPVFSHAVFGGLGLVMIVGLLCRGRPSDVPVAAMVASAWAFALTFAVISIACDYRYFYFLDLAVIAAALYVAATWRGADEAAMSPARKGGGRP